jgi:hypothetical protein
MASRNSNGIGRTNGSLQQAAIQTLNVSFYEDLFVNPLFFEGCLD